MVTDNTIITFKESKPIILYEKRTNDSSIQHSIIISKYNGQQTINSNYSNGKCLKYKSTKLLSVILMEGMVSSSFVASTSQKNILFTFNLPFKQF